MVRVSTQRQIHNTAAPIHRAVVSPLAPGQRNASMDLAFCRRALTTKRYVQKTDKKYVSTSMATIPITAGHAVLHASTQKSPRQLVAIKASAPIFATIII